MGINFSRHARRRMRLYKIDETDIRTAVEYSITTKGLIEGKHEIINHDLKIKYGYPLKTVFVIENNRVKVITAYPLKKERAR